MVGIEKRYGSRPAGAVHGGMNYTVCVSFAVGFLEPQTVHGSE